MITIGLIRNGANYLTHHLRKNDYWAEGEKAVEGVWIGEGAKALGLSGPVDEKAFDALRINRNPGSGEPLTPRDQANRVAFFDIQLSAPKDVSVLAMVGGDARVRTAFRESVEVVLVEMERYAAVRERRGNAASSEQFNLTGNFVGAMFLHDTSRDLDPQLHVHAVLANASWSAERKQWLALKQCEMLRASPYLRQVLYRELAGRLRALGYETHGMNTNGFAVRGVEHLRERYSKRAAEVRRLAEAFEKEKGRAATKGEIAVMVRESRADKLTEVSTPEVRARQQAELSTEERDALAALVAGACRAAPRETRSQGAAKDVLDAALRHVFERVGVEREGVLFSAALELHPEFNDWRALRPAMEANEDVFGKNGQLTLRSVWREELRTAELVRDARNTRFFLGSVDQLPESLTPGQRLAATELLRNQDFVSVLIGDAGTGKTTVLIAIQAGHVALGGHPFIPLAPTAKARDALIERGFAGAQTVQRFLMDPAMRAQLPGRVLLVDEAGMLSMSQLASLTTLAHEARGRLLLVGDTKQHYSVERGDGLRNILKYSLTKYTRLTEVLRQRGEQDRHISKLLAEGDIYEAFGKADRAKQFREVGEGVDVFEKAAEHFVENRSRGIDTLVVIPFWEEIERFNSAVRPRLRAAGLLGVEEVERQSIKTVSLTQEQMAHWAQYEEGDRLFFVRDTRFFKRGTSAKVLRRAWNGLWVRDEKGREAKITKKHRGTYHLGRGRRQPVAVGDKLLIQGKHPGARFENGDILEVSHVDAASNTVRFADGRELPPDFEAWTYAHAVTSYRSQGTTAEESLLVLGEVSERAIDYRQYYVGSTRYRGAHTIYVRNKEAVLYKVARPSFGRELATEFMERHSIQYNMSLFPGPIRRLSANLRLAWLAMVAQQQRARRVEQRQVI